MATSTLKFTATKSITAFKAENNITAINVIKNPHTSKLFFTSPDNSEINGKVGSGWETDPVISSCTDSVTAETFYMLHKRGDNTENVLATL